MSGLLTRWLAIAKFFRASLPGGRRGHRRCLSPIFPNGVASGILTGSRRPRSWIQLPKPWPLRFPTARASGRCRWPCCAAASLRPVGLGHRRLFQRLCPVWHPAGPRAGAMDRCDAAGGRPALRRHAGLRSPSGAAGRGRTLAAQDVPGQSRLGHAVGPPIAYWSFFLPVEYQLFCIVILIGLGTGRSIPTTSSRRSRRSRWRAPRCTSPWWRAGSPMWPPRWRSRTTCIARIWTPCGWATRTWRCWSRCGAKEAAERSNLEKSRFLAAASHDLRQPVHAVSLFLGLLTNETHRAWPLPGGQHRQRDGGDGASVRRLAQHLQAGRRRDRAPAQVVPAQSAAGAVAGRVCAAGGAERLVAAGQAQQGGGDPDPVLLERILRNLISNAIAHTRRGGVLVGCRHRRGGVRILVCDTGPGIPPSEQERVFWEFHQLNNPERDRSRGWDWGWPSCGAPPRCWTIRWSWHRGRGAAPCSRWAWRRAPPRRWPRRQRRPSPRRRRPPPATRSRTTGAGGWCWWSTTMRRTWPA